MKPLEEGNFCPGLSGALGPWAGDGWWPTVPCDTQRGPSAARSHFPCSACEAGARLPGFTLHRRCEGQACSPVKFADVCRQPQTLAAGSSTSPVSAV